MNSLADQIAPGPGHNRGPLIETLDEDFAALAKRAADVRDAMTAAVIIDDESAAKVADLMEIARRLTQDVEQTRKTLQQPYADAVKLIAGKATTIAGPITAGRDGLRAMLTAWERKREAEAEAARQKAMEEQRRREEEAAAARAKADALKEAGGNAVAADLDAMAAEDAAERAALRASAIRPEPIRTNLGRVTRSREIKFEIEDGRKAIAWLWRERSLRSSLLQAVRTMIGAHLRSLGVDQVEAGVAIDGCKVWVEKGAASVRR